jgi:hypothetical protein
MCISQLYYLGYVHWQMSLPPDELTIRKYQEDRANEANVRMNCVMVRSQHCRCVPFQSL